MKMALPLMFGQLGQMAMILIDMFMLGKLGPQAIGGAGLGSAIFYVFAFFGAGTLYGLDYLVSHAFGRKDLKECHYWLYQSVWLALCLSLPFACLLRWLAGHIDVFHFTADLSRSAAAFLSTLSLSLPPFLIFIAFRQYLQATNSVRPGSIITLLAIFSNICMNLVFIFGMHWGSLTVPAMGVAGAGLATTVTRTLMAISIVIYTFHRDKRLAWGLADSPRGFDLAGVRKLFSMGAPVGVQVTLEAAVFTFAASLLGRVGVVATASHTIVLNISSFTYMVPLGVSSATAVLVGQQMGRKSHSDARLAGWTSLGLATLIMAMSGLTLVTFSTPIVTLFTQDVQVIALSRQLLFLVAIYQVADGLQVVGAGALRGLGDTRSAMVANLLGYWVVGLPLGYWLCFSRAMGAVGLWLGLTVGLFVIAAFVLWRWVSSSRVF